jgi:hypothetical protein
VGRATTKRRQEGLDTCKDLYGKQINADTEPREDTTLSVGVQARRFDALRLSADGLCGHGLVDTLSFCCYARAAKAHVDGMLRRMRPAIESLFQDLSAEDSRR